MKGLMVLILVLVIGYVAYQMMSPEDRSKVWKFVRYHGFRLGPLLLVVFALAGAAYYMSVFQLTF